MWQLNPWFNHWKHSLLRNCLDVRTYCSKQFTQLITAENLLAYAQPGILMYRYKYAFINSHIYIISPIPSKYKKGSQFSFKSNRGNSLVPTNSAYARASSFFIKMQNLLKILPVCKYQVFFFTNFLIHQGHTAVPKIHTFVHT